MVFSSMLICHYKGIVGFAVICHLVVFLWYVGIECWPLHSDHARWVQENSQGYPWGWLSTCLHYISLAVACPLHVYFPKCLYWLWDWLSSSCRLTAHLSSGLCKKFKCYLFFYSVFLVLSHYAYCGQSRPTLVQGNLVGMTQSLECTVHMQD